MEHEPTWFQVLLGSVYTRLEEAAQTLSRPVNDQGATWMTGGPIGIDHVLGAILVVGGLIAIAAGVRRRLRRPADAIVPQAELHVGSVVELLVSTTYSMMSDIMGRKAAKTFLPLIGTYAFFILCCNLLGLVPGFVPPTSTLNTTLALAVSVIIITHVYGLRENGWDYVAHFLGPMRRWYWLPLMLLIASIEVFSHFLVRPGSLAVRLMANMTADHMVLSTFHHLHPVVALGLPVVMYLLGTLVCVVQTLVFCMLSTVYIALAIQHQEH